MNPSDQTPALDQRFAEAWINRDDHRVCGQWLDPYCQHHLLLLQLLESPLLGGAGEISWADLFMAVVVCSTPYGREVRMTRTRRLGRWLFWRSLWLRIRLSFRRPVFTSARVSAFLLRQECAKFRAFQNDFQSEPSMFFDSEGDELTAPGQLARVVFMQRHLHLSPGELWTMPVGQFLWTYAATLEQIGNGISLTDEEDDKILRLARQIQRGEIEIPESLRPETLEAEDRPLSLDRALGRTR